MKKCPDCGKDVSKSAKVCPNCGKKLKKPIVLYVVLAIIALCIIGGVISSNQEKNRKKDFAQNEIATYKDVEYSITKVERTQGSNEYLKPKDGYEYVIITLSINNKSSEKISYNALDWKIVTSDGSEDTMSSISVADTDTNLSSGDLNAGGTKVGTVSCEVPKNDKLKLKYYETIADTDYKLQFTLD